MIDENQDYFNRPFLTTCSKDPMVVAIEHYQNSATAVGQFSVSV